MTRTAVTPHGTRRGWLKNGNPAGDFSNATCCGAKTWRGTPCQCRAIANGRCRLHGGLSTGPSNRAAPAAEGDTGGALAGGAEGYSKAKPMRELEVPVFGVDVDYVLSERGSGGLLRPRSPFPLGIAEERRPRRQEQELCREPTIPKSRR